MATAQMTCSIRSLALLRLNRHLGKTASEIHARLNTVMQLPRCHLRHAFGLYILGHVGRDISPTSVGGVDQVS